MKSFTLYISRLVAIVICTITVLMPNHAMAGKESHGGDLVLCEKSTENEFEGLYSLDYIVGRIQLGQAYPLDESLFSQEPQEKISETLSNLLPVDSVVGLSNKDLLDSWQNYVQLKDNHSDFTQERIWLPSSYGLIDINDEALITLLPSNCLKDKTNQNPHAIQAVIRQQPGATVIYNFSEDMIAQIKKRPLQYSFLMLHEWLWDRFEDVRLVRFSNWLIHAAAKKDANISQIQAQLLKLKFATTEQKPEAVRLVTQDLLKAIVENNILMAENALQRGATWNYLVALDINANVVTPHQYRSAGEAGIFSKEQVPEKLSQLLKDRMSSQRDETDYPGAGRVWYDAFTNNNQGYEWVGYNLASLTAMLGRKEFITRFANEIAKTEPKVFEWLMQTSFRFGDINTMLAFAPAWNQHTDTEQDLWSRELLARRWWTFIPLEKLNQLVAAYQMNMPAPDLLVRVGVLNRDISFLEKIHDSKMKFPTFSLLNLSLAYPKEGFTVKEDEKGNRLIWVPQQNEGFNIFYWAIIQGDYPFAEALIDLIEREPNFERMKQEMNSESRKLDFLAITNGKKPLTRTAQNPLDFAQQLRSAMPKEKAAQLDVLIQKLERIYK